MNLRTEKAIDVAQPWECGYWSGRFGVHNSELLAAIAVVGTNPLDVHQHLSRKSVLARIGN